MKVCDAPESKRITVGWLAIENVHINTGSWCSGHLGIIDLSSPLLAFSYLVACHIALALGSISRVLLKVLLVLLRIGAILDSMARLFVVETGIRLARQSWKMSAGGTRLRGLSRGSSWTNENRLLKWVGGWARKSMIGAKRTDDQSRLLLRSLGGSLTSFTSSSFHLPLP
jgi:hypothetical protein